MVGRRFRRTGRLRSLCQIIFVPLASQPRARVRQKPGADVGALSDREPLDGRDNRFRINLAFHESIESLPGLSLRIRTFAFRIRFPKFLEILIDGRACRFCDRPRVFLF